MPTSNSDTSDQPQRAASANADTFRFDQWVTVTLTDQHGETHTIHARYGHDYQAITTPAANGAWHHERIDSPRPSSRRWALIGPADDSGWMRLGRKFPQSGPDHERWASAGLRICLDSDNVRITPMTPEGIDSTIAASSATAQITHYLDKFAATDPRSADLLREAINQAVEEAAEEAERQSATEGD